MSISRKAYGFLYHIMLFVLFSRLVFAKGFLAGGAA